MSLFRVAGDHPPWRHALHTALQIVAFWSFFLWLLPAAVAAAERAVALPPMQLACAAWLGPVLFAACSALGLWSAAVMSLRGAGTPLPLAAAQRMVLAGPYRWIRNPMAFAGIGQGVAVGIWRDSAGVVLYALCGAVAWHTIARPPEERDLLQRFGDDYARYRARVPIWLPWRAPAVLERTGAGLLMALAATLFARDGVTLPAAVAFAAFALLCAYWLSVRPRCAATNAHSSGHSAAKSSPNAS